MTRPSTIQGLSSNEFLRGRIRKKRSLLFFFYFFKLISPTLFSNVFPPSPYFFEYVHCQWVGLQAFIGEIGSQFLGYYFAEKYTIVLNKVCRMKCALSKLNNSLGVLLFIMYPKMTE